MDDSSQIDECNDDDDDTDKKRLEKLNFRF